MSELYDSRQDTLDHISKVQGHLLDVELDLRLRMRIHDASKLQSPEKEVFDSVTPKLKALTYGSDEYKAALAEMGDALKHHYEHNSHHPEHFIDGVNDMTLVDIIEMLCDWKAASERHANGDFAESLRINRERFHISNQLYSILLNTAIEKGWIQA